jgi:hypothetical protein
MQEVGGISFRDSETFNQALLAKQAWRLLTVLDSLCTRVLQARYLPNGDILTTSCPRSMSFICLSILHGRDLLRQGLVWHIGDVREVDMRSARIGSLGTIYNVR